MERLLRLLVAVCVLVSPGCSWIPHITRKTDPFGERAPCALSPDVTKDELVAHLNKNINGADGHAGLTSWQATVKVHAKGAPVSVPAHIAVEGPRNFRLRVTNPMSGACEMDMGSNNERFWVWAKEDPNQSILTCQHEDIGMALSAMQMPLPFHPDWLMEVLGVVPLDPAEFRMERPSATSPYVDLVAERSDPSGKFVQRVIHVNACHGIITDHELRTADGRQIARANLSGHYKDPNTQIVLPKQIRIDWPEMQNTYIVLDFKQIDVNPMLSAESPIWSLPAIPGATVHDMGEAARRNAGLPPRNPSDPGAVQMAEGLTETQTAEATSLDGDAPAWANDAEGGDAVDGATDAWQPPNEAAGEAALDDFETPAAGEADSEAELEPAPVFDPTVRMQSPKAAAEAKSQRGFFRWPWLRKRSAAAPPAGYSPAASQSSSVQPRLGRE